MGYSRSPQAILKVAHVLDRLVTSTTEVIVPSSDPDKLRYQVRSGMMAAKELGPDNFRDLHWMWSMAVDRAQGILTITRQEYARLPKTKRTELPMGTHATVFMSQIEENGDRTEAYKMRSQFSDTEKLTLWNWLQRKAPEWEIMVSDAGVIVTREEGFAGQGWSPSV